jgi:lantibiotic protection ABC transporter permease subunit, MutG family
MAVFPLVRLLRLVRADWLKTRRTPLRLAVVAAPAACALLLLGYFSRFQASPELPQRMLAAFCEVWTALFPLGIGVLAGLLSLQEEHAGNCGALLGSAAPRPAVYGARLLLLSAVCAGGALCAVTMLLIGMRTLLGIAPVDAGMFYAGVLLAIAGSLPQIAFHQWLAFAAGWGASVGAGGAGLLMAAMIGATSAGDRIWPFVPWAWPVRLAQIPAQPEALARGLPAALLLFIVLAACGIWWFGRWEGRRGHD